MGRQGAPKMIIVNEEKVECNRILEVNTGHMGNHLTKVHQFSETEWAAERAYLSVGNVILPREELVEQQRSLEIAFCF
jgi:hypothetical protein